MASEMKEQTEAALLKLKRKRNRLFKQITANEKIKRQLINRCDYTTEHYNRVTARIGRRTQAAKEYRKTIAETQAAYQKIVDSSYTLLSLLQMQAGDSDVEPDEDEDPFAAAQFEEEQKKNDGGDEANSLEEDDDVEEANSIEDDMEEVSEEEEEEDGEDGEDEYEEEEDADDEEREE
jgi:hypothetical protein